MAEPHRLALVATPALAKACRLSSARSSVLIATTAAKEEGVDPYASQVLRPLLNGCQHQMDRLIAQDFDGFCVRSQEAADRLLPRVAEGIAIWFNDYPLIAVGALLRKRRPGPVGLYLHAPFAPPETMAALPDAVGLRDLMLTYDAIGFQTERDMENFAAWVCEAPSVRRPAPDRLEFGGRTLRLFSQPFGIDPAEQRALADRLPQSERIAHGIRTSRRQRQIVSVDRDLLVGGWAERLDALRLLFGIDAGLAERLTLYQVAPAPAQSSPDAERWTALAARAMDLCGSLATLNWDPVRLIGRELDPKMLAGLYRGADIGLFTADAGRMSVEAKRFVASQRDADPGVLVLSSFDDASGDAMIANPFDAGTTAKCLLRALRMPLEERRLRHQALLTELHENSAARWHARLASVLADEGKISLPAAIATAAA